MADADVAAAILARLTGFQQPGYFWDQRLGRRRGLHLLGVSVAGCCAAYYWRERARRLDPAKEGLLGQLLHNHAWVVYDPRCKTLGPDRKPVYAKGEDSVSFDLELIARAGFDGIVTSSSDALMAKVPRSAKRLGLQVIMGIWDPSDRGELSRAVRVSSNVDAFCVGVNGLGPRYSMSQLANALDHVRSRTGLPVTTSEIASYYTDELAALGDWLFPDAHLTLKDRPDVRLARVDVDRDVQLFLQSTGNMVDLARRLDRFLMFNNVCYPYAGVAGSSRVKQAEFFRRILEALRDPLEGASIRVSIAAHSAFDASWKRGLPFLAWDPFTGLIDTSTLGHEQGKMPDGNIIRTAAAREILEWYPNRPKRN